MYITKNFLILFNFNKSTQTTSLTKKNISKLKSVYIKLFINFLQIISLLNFLHENEEESTQKSFNKIIEMASGYFISIISMECLLQGFFVIFNLKSVF